MVAPLIQEPPPEPEATRIRELEREVGKLRRINKALMDRVERSMDFQGGAFSLFQTAIVLENKVRERTVELERSNRALARAKEVAETAQNRLKEAIDTVNEGFALFDAEDHLVLCNSKYPALWPEVSDRIRPGMRFVEIARLVATTRSVTDAYPHPEDWINERMVQHADPRGPYIHRLGNGRWVQINERRTRDGGVVGVHTDITDIKLHEARRRERELAGKSALLQATLDNIVQGVSAYDAEGRLVAWNDRFVELLELPPEVTQPGAGFDAFVRCNAALGERGLAPAVLLGTGLFEHVWHDGSVLEIRRNPMPDGGFVTTYTDITERKRSEQALRDGEQRIRLITDAMPALIAYVDAEERYRFVNRPYEDWFKRPRPEIVGQTMRTVLGQPCYAQRALHVREALAGREAIFEVELPGDAGAGSVRYALATYIPHFGEQRAVLGFFALIQDITERRLVAQSLEEAKEGLERRVEERTAALTALNAQLHQEIAERRAAEEALRLAKAEAERANLSKTKFLAAASHDLLQPLNAARLFVSALGEMEQTPPNKAMIGNTDVALGAVEDLLAALLDISKLDAGAVRPEITDFPIKALFGGMATEYAAMAKDRGLGFGVVSSSAVVRSDIRLLRRILQNFLSNALRYTRAGRVLIGCRRRPEGLRIEVWDTGTGIPEDKFGEIFEEFHRLDAPVGVVSPRDRGIGLGLAIVDRVARMLGHRISVRSRPGRGSVFAVTVPFGERRPPAGFAVPALRPATNRLSGALVLVIDNEQSILTGMRALLEGWSCRVLTATSGDEALALLALAERAPDIVIVDYHLDHGILGIAVLDRIRHAHARSIPGLVITANRTAEVLREVQANGDPLLNKPVKPAQLRAIMTSVLS